MRNGRVVVVRSSKGLWRTPLVALSAALVLGTLLAGCALVDTVDKRADWMNESVGRFRNQTILRNIVRSARDEPLSFAALSQVEGHNTSVNQFPTFPSFDWLQGRVGTTGSTNSQYNVSSDFTLNPIEDPASHAALLNPLDASTIPSSRSAPATRPISSIFCSSTKYGLPIPKAGCCRNSTGTSLASIRAACAWETPRMASAGRGPCSAIPS